MVSQRKVRPVRRGHPGHPRGQTNIRYEPHHKTSILAFLAKNLRNGSTENICGENVITRMAAAAQGIPRPGTPENRRTYDSLLNIVTKELQYEKNAKLYAAPYDLAVLLERNVLKKGWSPHRVVPRHAHPKFRKAIKPSKL